ncbi:MAG: ATP/GTP-binding protein [Sideroxydans sp.]|nr:ATP/GTP-binding protein [Sideroxydans sp.]
MNPAPIKLVFTGPVGSGKTTALHQLSEITPVVTEQAMTVGATVNKTTTTVALDYGEVTLENGEKVLLFGTPGQRYYDYMCKIVAQGATGIMLLLNNDNADPQNDLAYFTELFADHAKRGAMVLGITHTEGARNNPLQRYHAWLSDRGYMLPVFAVDARNRDDVILMVEALAASLEY